MDVPDDRSIEEFLHRVRELARRQAELAGRHQQLVPVLLPGEDPRSPLADDARHWAIVYDRLVEFKEQILTTAEEGRRRLPPPASLEAHYDERVLGLELERLRLHRQFWVQRARSLAPDEEEDQDRLRSRLGGSSG
ncbi:MAG TPA: hypothetical protein VFD49_02795 [Candidatus Dormibacteraeota bacterium]|nr:hypothetical protein [Candidatus Dormibacteraeota bacterium]